jgi:hypothetical protein
MTGTKLLYFIAWGYKIEKLVKLKMQIVKIEYLFFTVVFCTVDNICLEIQAEYYFTWRIGLQDITSDYISALL